MRPKCKARAAWINRDEDLSYACDAHVPPRRRLPQADDRIVLTHHDGEPESVGIVDQVEDHGEFGYTITLNGGRRRISHDSLWRWPEEGASA